MEQPFSEDEAKAAIWEMTNGNAPRLNGFPIAFYKVCWDILKRDLMMVFEDFFHKEILDKGSNATYISRIPKKEGVEEIGDF